MTAFADPPSKLDRAAFITRFGGIYAHNPWVAAAVFDGGNVSDTVGGLAEAMRKVVDGTPEDAKLLVLRAHAMPPGAIPDAEAYTAAGPEVLRAEATAEPLAYRRLTVAYQTRFDFPFVVDPVATTAAAIVEQLAQRLGNSRSTEFSLALEAVHAMARARLEALAAKA